MSRRAPTPARRTPWEADPLSWLAVPNLPLAAIALTLVYGVASISSTLPEGTMLVVQAGALLTALGGMLWVHLATRPRRGALTGVAGSIAVGLVGTSFLLSAWGYRGTPVAIDLWWPPLAASVLLLAMAPYSTPLRLLGWGTALMAAGVLSVGVFGFPDPAPWPRLSTLVIVAAPALFGMAGGIAFVSTVTARLTRWSERPWADPSREQGSGDGRPTDEVVDPLISQVDEQTSSQLAEALDLLAAVVDRGEIIRDDQVRAQRVATRLRGELLTAANDSWLERSTRTRPVQVDDPDRLADRLGVRQRTALRAMLDALLEDPASGFVSARIELRRSSAESIAVGLRIFTTLPEGRRVTFLAPYYVSLQSAVSNIRWRNGSSIAVDFVTTADPGEEGPGHAASGSAPRVTR